MKKLFALLVVSSLAGFAAQAQECRLMRDSLIVGNRATTYSDYIYSGAGVLGEVLTKDSGSVNVTQAMALLYTGTNLTETRNINVAGGSVLEDRTFYTYDGNNRVTRIVAEAADSSWRLTHDVTYDGSGNLQNVTMVADSPNTYGSVKGIEASFTNITWSNGNVASLNLEVFGTTIELVTTVDDKKNIYKHLANTEGASFLFQAAGANNIVTVALVNEEVIGDTVPAGTLAVNNTYTYYPNGEVETMEQGPSLFSDNPNTRQFIFDCTVGIGSPVAATTVGVYPNPATEFIQLKNENFRGAVRVYDIAGKVVMTTNINTNQNTLDVRSLQPGVYSIEMTDKNDVFKGKFVKN